MIGKSPRAYSEILVAWFTLIGPSAISRLIMNWWSVMVKIDRPTISSWMFAFAAIDMKLLEKKKKEVAQTVVYNNCYSKSD